MPPITAISGKLLTGLRTQYNAKYISDLVDLFGSVRTNNLIHCIGAYGHGQQYGVVLRDFNVNLYTWRLTTLQKNVNTGLWSYINTINHPATDVINGESFFYFYFSVGRNGYGEFPEAEIILRGYPTANESRGLVNKVSFNGGSKTFTSTGQNDLTSPNPTINHYFGRDVFQSYSKLIIGAPGYNSNRGIFYVFNLDGTVSSTIIPSANAPLSGISLVSDYIHSDDNKIIINCSKQNDFRGIVYIYNMDGTNEIIITPPAGVSFTDVKISSNENIVIIAAPTYNGNRGGIFLYDTSGNFIKIITCPDIEENYVGFQVLFGSAISIFDNNKIAVGAPNFYSPPSDGVAAHQSGRCYVFNKTGGLLKIIKCPKPPRVNDQLRFGSQIYAINKTLFIDSKWMHTTRAGIEYTDVGATFEFKTFT